VSPLGKDNGVNQTVSPFDRWQVMGTGDCFECAIDGQRDWHGVTI